MSAEVDEAGAVTNLYLSSTTDGGQSWQTSAFDAFDPGGGYSAPGGRIVEAAGPGLRRALIMAIMHLCIMYHYMIAMRKDHPP